MSPDGVANLARRSRASNRGFTLVETISVIVILGVIGSLISKLMMTSVDVYTSTSVRSELHGIASVALDRVLREVREIASDPVLGAPSPYITEASVTALSWDSGRSVELTDTNVMLNTDGVHSDVLCDGAAVFALDFLDEDGASLLSGTQVPAGSLPSIRVVTVWITLTQAGIDESLHSRAFIRSCMDASD